MHSSKSMWNLTERMVRSFFFYAVLAGSLCAGFVTLRVSSAQQMGGIASKHVLIQMPSERESLGRELIADFERCYEFINRATNGSLPQKILINVNWELSDSRCNWRDASILIGMNQPETDKRALLFHSTTREIARLGLFGISQGIQREDTEFLYEGMIEILAHEFDHTSRHLEAAWAFARLLDEMKMLGFATQRSWSVFSGDKRSLRNAAPGITFLAVFRELQGRERPMKLFEALKKNSLMTSLSLAFKAPAAELETIWLKKVREYSINEINEITTVAEEAPQLIQTSFVPGKSGKALQLHIFLEDRAGNLLPNGVFVKDERTGLLVQTQTSSEKDARFLTAAIPVAENCPPGKYQYQITAIDESGNLRRWTRSYTISE
jgi:hypothetical protein